MKNENSVTEVTENVEQTTEQNNVQEETQEQKGKFYTDEELDKMLADRYNRGRRKAEKESRKKYGRLENILKSGLEVSSLNEAEKKLEDFYTEQGVQIPTYYDEDDIRTLADKDAEEIIADGDVAVERELRRLSDLGTDKMSKREKAMFETLYNSHKATKERQELEEIGVGSELLDSKEFKDFTKNLNPNLSVKQKYEFYKQTHPTQQAEPIGSMTNTETGNSFKDSYTEEEISKLSLDDLSDDRVWEAVRKSMTKKG